MNNTKTAMQFNRSAARIGLSVPVKVSLAGPSAAGKSSLMQRFCDGEFRPQDVSSTVGVDCGCKNVYHSASGRQFKLQMWDTAGQEHFRSLTAGYFRDSMAVLLVFDSTDPKSVAQIQSHLTDVRHANPDMPVLLVANKFGEDDVKHPMAMNYHAVVDRLLGTDGGEFAGFVKTSAKTGHNVEEVFSLLAEVAIEEYLGAETDILDIHLETVSLLPPATYEYSHNADGTRSDADTDKPARKWFEKVKLKCW